MAENPFNDAWVRAYLATTGRTLAPGSMALEERTFPAPGCTVHNAALVTPLPRILQLTLPFPPTLNHLRAWVNGQCRTSKAGRDYCARVGEAVSTQHGYVAALTGSLQVTVIVHPPDRRRRDLDNLGKCLLDALQNAGVYENDSQIDDLRYIRGETTQPGHITVTLQQRSTT